MLKDAECFFGGGTAIVLSLGEYRESIDLDFLCSSKDGYRQLRQAVYGPQGLRGILKPNSEVAIIRDVQADQYGIRSFLSAGDTRIKFEIVKESRADLYGELDARYGVPVLNQTCMYVEKLLANADRWPDKSVLSRDIIDLMFMQSRLKSIPDEAWEIAYSAYGETVRKAYNSAIAMLKEPNWLHKCMQGMAIDLDLKDEIMSQLDRSFPN